MKGLIKHTILAKILSYILLLITIQDVVMSKDDVSLSDNSSNSEDEIDRFHNKAKEALEKAKVKIL